MYILGLHTSHDTSACLIKDGKIVVAVEKERLTRHKHQWGNADLDSIAKYCLDFAGISLSDVAYVVVNEINNLFKDRVYCDRDHHIGHHLAHAWAAVGLSPFDECAVLIIDGEGSKVAELSTAEVEVCVDKTEFFAEKESCYDFADQKLSPIRKWTSGRGGDSKFSGTDATGSPYWILSQTFFNQEHQESKVMGLAAYGNDSGGFHDIFQLLPEGQVLIDTHWIYDLHRLPSNDVDSHFTAYSDIAAQIQSGTERAVIHKARWLQQKTGAKNLCFSGGVALNCVANSKLKASNLFENVFVPFGAGDSSIAIGCAFYGWNVLARQAKQKAPCTPFLGKNYSSTVVAETLKPFAEASLLTASDRAEFTIDAARSLFEGEVVAWFQGRSEFGPRALGNRSILGNPSLPDMRERLNARVKKRELFRPLAPSVIEEHAGEWFDNIVPGAYFMQFVAGVKHEKRAQLPAVTHVDGTARIQLVPSELNPEFYTLLKSFQSISGVPILLNTSFNIQEPIVESPQDAILTFLGSSIDSLYIGRYRVKSLVRFVKTTMDFGQNDCFAIGNKDFQLRYASAHTFTLQITSGQENIFRFGNFHQVTNYPETEISESLFDLLSRIRIPTRGFVQLTATQVGLVKANFAEFDRVMLQSRIYSLITKTLEGDPS